MKKNAERSAKVSRGTMWSMILFMAVIAGSISFAYSQNGVLIAPTAGSPDASSMLEVKSSTKGFLTPRMTASQRLGITNPAEGLLVYQTEVPSGFWYYNGSGWTQISSGDYINNGTSSQTANFNITGYGYAGNFLQSPNIWISNYKHTALGYENVYSDNNGDCGFQLLLNNGNRLGFLYGNSGFGIGICNGSGNWAMLAGGSPNSTNTSIDLRTNNLQRLYIDGSGNVGIGTTSPSQKLEVSGNAKVNGNIELGDNLMTEGSSAYRVYRNLASYSVEASSQGAFVINTRQPWNSGCMFRAKIEGYFYDASATFETSLGAYMYTNNTFVNRGYVNSGAKNLGVRLARNISTNTVAIILGSESEFYPYPKLSVTSFTQGFGGIDPSYADGWTIAQLTSLAGYDYIDVVPDVTPASNLGNAFIQNQTASVQTAGFNISGQGYGRSYFAWDWFRAQGNTGLYFQDHGGGWYMLDNDWIRTYGSKKVYIDNMLEADGGIASGNLPTPGSGNIGFSGGYLKSGGSNFISDAASQTTSVFSWRGTCGYNCGTADDYMIVNHSGIGAPGTTYGNVYANAYFYKTGYGYYDIINDLDAIDRMRPLAGRDELMTDPESMPSFLCSKAGDGSGYYYDVNKIASFSLGAVRQLRQETRTGDHALEAKVERLEKIVEALTSKPLGEIEFEQQVTAFKGVQVFAVIDARISREAAVSIRGVSGYEIYDQKDGSFMIRFKEAPTQDMVMTYSSSY